MAAILNYWMAIFKRSCGETLDTVGRSNQTVRSDKRRIRRYTAHFFSPAFQLLIAYIQLGTTLTAKIAKNFPLQWQDLLEQLQPYLAIWNVYAYMRVSTYMRPAALDWSTSYTLPKGRQSQAKLQFIENLKRSLNPHSDRRPDHPGEFSQSVSIWIERPIKNFQKSRAVDTTALLEGSADIPPVLVSAWLSPLKT